MTEAHGHDDFQTEPVPGLPERPPEGERILWQGAPAWRALAWRAFGVRWVLLYFAAIALWQGGEAALGGATPGEILPGLGVLAGVALAAVAVLGLMAWVAARATIYTVTTKRVAMRIGVALTVTLNLPYRWIGAAALKRFRDGTGDLPLALTGETRLAYLMLWPHVRPWRLGRAEPALRAIPDAGRVAEILAGALRSDAAARSEAAGAAEAAAEPRPEPAPAPAPQASPSPGLVPAE